MSMPHSLGLKLCAHLSARRLFGLRAQTIRLAPVVPQGCSRLTTSSQRPYSTTGPRNKPDASTCETSSAPPIPPAYGSPLLHHLSSIVQKYQHESVVYKLSRFKSRIEDAEVRIARLVEVLQELAMRLGVQEDRLHPLVKCEHVLKLDTFSSLREILSELYERTPLNATELATPDVDAVRLEGKIPEVQLSTVKQILGEFYKAIIPAAEWPRWEKTTLRSARGRARLVHKLVANSLAEFETMQGKDGVSLKGQDLVEDYAKRYALGLKEKERKRKGVEAREEKAAKRKAKKAREKEDKKRRRRRSNSGRRSQMKRNLG